MKLLIVSDSHGSTAFLEKALQRERSADIIVHCGDGADDLDLFREYTSGKLVYQNRGNMDFYCRDCTDSCLFPADGVMIFTCHGHKFDVKNGLLSLSFAAKSKNARVCLFGHTHLQYLDDDGELLLMNPGSIRNGLYATLEIKNGELFPELKSI